MEETQQTEIKEYTENNKPVSFEDANMNFLMEKILGEQFAVSIGNFIFIPPIENPKVSSPDRAYKIMQESKVVEGYVHLNIKIDDQPTNFFIHMSRMVNENEPPSVTLYNIDKVNESDLKIAFKNQFPDVFVKTVAAYLDYKKSIGCDSENIHAIGN